MIDLYLGAGIGLWALNHVGNSKAVRHVVSPDEGTRVRAASLGYRALEATPEPASIDGGIGVSVHFPRLFPGQVIERYERMYNLHPGYLPWGRGYFPVFWALFNGEPAGCTFHEINEGVDNGPLIDQTRVEIHPADTGESLHQRVIATEKELFARLWPLVERGVVPASVVSVGKGSYHSLSDFLSLRDQPDLSGLTGHDLLRLVRALTFSGRPGPQVQFGETHWRLLLEPSDD